MGKQGKDREYTAPAVDRALDILEFMTRNPQPFGATELSRELDVPINSVFRILRRLAERKYTIQDPDTGEYSLTNRIFTLGMSLYTRFDLRLRARPHLEWLCRETEETCQLQVPKYDRMLVVDCIVPETEFYIQIVPGSLVYYHPNAYGKAVIAFQDKEEIESCLPLNLPRLTSKTIVFRPELEKHLVSVRSTGLAYDMEEYTDGIICIGAPVFDVTGKVIAGLGTTCLLSTLDEFRKSLCERLVLECAGRVSRDIGYTGDFFTERMIQDPPPRP